MPPEHRGQKPGLIVFADAGWGGVFTNVNKVSAAGQRAAAPRFTIPNEPFLFRLHGYKFVGWALSRGLQYAFNESGDCADGGNLGSTLETKNLAFLPRETKGRWPLQSLS